MSWFGKIKETGLVHRKSNDREVTVSVPDIKEYLVREYNRVNELKLVNEGLQQQVEEAEELKLKYDATLVTLDEYRRRLERAETEIKTWKENCQRARQDVRAAKDEVNSYKIKFNEAAITKLEIEKEIVDDVKSDIISLFRSLKGNLSKKIVCEVIAAYERKQSV